MQKIQLQNTLQPILQDISVVKRIANALTAKLQTNPNPKHNTIKENLKIEDYKPRDSSVGEKKIDNDEKKVLVLIKYFNKFKTL